MKIIIDTREKSNMAIMKVLNEKDIKWQARKLEYGDYSFEIDGISYENKCVIERKMSITELSGNVCQGRVRFETELSKAKSDNCKMILLVEDKNARAKFKLRIAMDAAGIDIETRYKKTWRTRCTGKSMVGSIKALKDRYDLDLLFCSKVDSAKEMLRIFEEYLDNENKICQ